MSKKVNDPTGKGVERDGFHTLRAAEKNAILRPAG
jgi:hypothetical protein